MRIVALYLSAWWSFETYLFFITFVYLITYLSDWTILLESKRIFSHILTKFVLVKSNFGRQTDVWACYILCDFDLINFLVNPHLVLWQQTSWLSMRRNATGQHPLLCKLLLPATGIEPWAFACTDGVLYMAVGLRVGSIHALQLWFPTYLGVRFTIVLMRNLKQKIC